MIEKTEKMIIPDKQMTNAWLFFSSFFWALLVRSRDTAVKMIEKTKPIIPNVIISWYPDAPISSSFEISVLNTPVSLAPSVIKSHSVPSVSAASTVTALPAK